MIRVCGFDVYCLEVTLAGLGLRVYVRALG